MKKKRSVLILLVLVLALSIGFALLSTTLKINGSALINKHTWDVHWENVDNESGVTPTTPATIDSNDNKIVNFEADVTIPGDYYEFTVDAVNRGTLDAMLKQIDVTINGTSVDDISDYLEFTIKYADGTNYDGNDLLPVGKKITYKVRLQYKKNITNDQLENIPEEGEPFVGEITPVYVQAGDDAVDKGNYVDIVVPAPVEVGDYIQIIPDAEYATTDVAGFSGSIETRLQKIWRVIKIYENGTFDAVSEYSSLYNITIGGYDGYKNYALGMQDLASKYEKEGYTIGSRMMGYDGQSLVIEDTSWFDGSTSSRPGSTTPTPLEGEGEEYIGGVRGDTLYLNDIKLVGDVYKTNPSRYGDSGLKAYTYNGSNTVYWIASRYYYNGTDSHYCGRLISNGGISDYYIRYWQTGRWKERKGSFSIRPIITLKSGLVIASGEGTVAHPYIFE